MLFVLSSTRRNYTYKLNLEWMQVTASHKKNNHQNIKGDDARIQAKQMKKKGKRNWKKRKGKKKLT